MKPINSFNECWKINHQTNVNSIVESVESVIPCTSLTAPNLDKDGLNNVAFVSYPIDNLTASYINSSDVVQKFKQTIKQKCKNIR